MMPTAQQINPGSALSREPSHADIELLAYRFWEERGRPFGTPEDDWFHAEAELARGSQGSEEPAGRSRQETRDDDSAPAYAEHSQAAPERDSEDRFATSLQALAQRDVMAKHEAIQQRQASEAGGMPGGDAGENSEGSGTLARREALAQHEALAQRQSSLGGERVRELGAVGERQRLVAPAGDEGALSDKNQPVQQSDVDSPNDEGKPAQVAEANPADRSEAREGAQTESSGDAEEESPLMNAARKIGSVLGLLSQI